MFVIIDYGTGNSGSILNMLRKVGVDGCVSSDPEVIKNSKALILPGVGAFDNAIKKFDESGLRSLIEEEVLVNKKPFLGVCLGMQLLFDKSEEGVLSGLGWIPGRVKRFNFDNIEAKLKVPHMGWSVVNSPNNSELFFEGFEEHRFYFVHSFHVVCDPKYVIGTAQYGYEFVCAVRKDNIWATQFHPEKSHKFGIQLFKQFVNLVC
ncbi:imidazole glycerol phosphate synthase subunit HisH [Pseudoalteromonas phenolica]|uniref:Imidazole glycerol phosphate synthase subunit HisH n=1 Tax=Pseudoalteromonas phenolica TaxID=161398 RepID=A0A5R9PWS2_9GAMM|nr:imidazole glycerol phosphate synthase subunit HisH [Pseudoalteromonas phenolica]TLX45358.1 imidazole glycerol phosphate synthase subunit HisH [Pseudoalteromonas phenolica]